MTTAILTTHEALSFLISDGAVVELRALGTSQRVVSGYFDKMDLLAQEAARLSGKASGVYITLNPVDPALLARCANRTKGYAKHTTGDQDIERRVWLFIDLDPVRPSGISATDEEHCAALERAKEVKLSLMSEGWPEPTVIDSGNGAYLLSAIDLPNNEASTRLMEKCLEVLDLRYSDGRVQIDTGVANAARVIRVPGTLNAKGDSLPERPHRLARIIQAPTKPEVLSAAQLELVANLAPPETARERLPHDRPYAEFNLDRWLSEHHVAITRPRPWKGGTLYVLETCPWNSSHVGTARVIRLASGALSAGCFHNGCQAKGWAELRDVIEPGRRAYRPTVHTNSANSANSENGEAAPWEPPMPFPEFSPAPFPTNNLPGWLARFVDDLATATQTPLDLAAMVVLSAISTAVAKKVEVEVKPGYCEPTNIYTVTAMEPGNRKSAVFRDATLPLQLYEEEETRRLASEIGEAQTAYRIVETRLKKAQDAAASAKLEERVVREEEARQCARELAGLKVPTPPRLIVDDISPERVATLLRDNNGRIAILSPEGDIFDLMAGRYSNGAPNLGVFLKGHAGDSLRVDRVGRPSEYVNSPAITMGLTVQPEVLRGLIDKPGFRGRGLLGRFLYSQPASLLGRRVMTARSMPAETRQTYHGNLRALLTMPFAVDGDGNIAPHRLRLSPGALGSWQQFEAWLEPQLARFGELGYMTDWAGKLAGAIARIAGLLHLAEYAQHPTSWRRQIEIQTMGSAIRMGHYFLEHARAAYAEMGADPVVEDARFVLGWLAKSGIATVSLRTIFEGTKGRVERVELLKPAIALLVDHAFLRERAATPRSGPGRKSSPTYEVNPAILTPSPHNSHNSQNRDECDGAGSRDQEAEATI